MSTNNVSIELVKSLVAKQALCSPEQLSADTRLGEDLGIVGDDAEELLSEFSLEFNVDMSALDFKLYFPSEASANMNFYLTTIAKSKYNNPLVNAVRFLESKFWKVFARQTDYITITIHDLLKIAQSRKW